jgi:hypothetical protein
VLLSISLLAGFILSSLILLNGSYVGIRTILAFLLSLIFILSGTTQRRNQRMADDQSIAGRRRIYYDSAGNEALICSESDEEIPQPEEEKHVFTEGEDQLIWYNNRIYSGQSRCFFYTY